jgi:hypothetical protein
VKGDYPLRSPSVWLTAFSVLLLVACGGGESRRAEPPKLDATLARQLAAEADKIADEVAVDGCRARTDLVGLRRRVASTVTAPFRRPLLNSIDRIAAEVPCEVSPGTTPPTTNEDEDEDHGGGRGKGGKKGKKKGRED